MYFSPKSNLSNKEENMKFVVAKSNNIECAGCPNFIMRGDDMVQTFVNTPTYKRVFSYHVTCYIPWFTAMFNQKWSDWKHGAGAFQRPRLGRPPTYIDPTKKQILNNLHSSLSYHKKLGHDIRVHVIEGKIDKVLSSIL